VDFQKQVWFIPPAFFTLWSL